MKAKLARRPTSPVVAQRQGAGRQKVRAKGVDGPAVRLAAGGLDAASLLRLQAVAGNQAVGGLLARPQLSVQAQAVACPPPPTPAAPISPHDDPAFRVVAGKVGQEAARQKHHPAATVEVDEAEAAAAGPTNEAASRAAASRVVVDMSRVKPRGFDRTAFVTAVHEAIEKATPRTMEEVDEMARSDRAAGLKDEVAGKVTAGKDAAARDIAAASSAPPDTTRTTVRPAIPMRTETPAPPPADVRAGDAMPSAKRGEEVSLAHTSCETDGLMAQAGVTEEQVRSSNEPEFEQALDAKKKADEHAEAAPGRFRQDERRALSRAGGEASTSATSGLTAMHHDRTTAAGHVATHKDEAKARNEAERAKLANELEGVYGATKREVDEILGGLDGQVAGRFDAGEKAARDAFNSYYRRKKDAYFDRRYGQAGGSLLWLKDKLTSPPPEVNGFISEAKRLYVSSMEQVIEGVGTLVESELNRASARIQEGRRQIQEKVAAAPKALRKFAQQAAGKFEGRFDELDQAVDSKSSGIVDDLAQRYVAASREVDDLCEGMRQENKGLLDRARDAVGGMVETIQKMKAMLAQVAARAETVVDRIVLHPIDFLGRLIDAVKMGFQQFTGNIGRHLEEGLLGWLFGELGDDGVTLPETFDLKGLFHLVVQVLGLTWDNIRARAVTVLGRPVVTAIEKGGEIGQEVVHVFEVIRTEGLAGLWHLEAAVIDQIKDFVVTKVITAGVTWILSLLNPVSAFIKACKAIYDIVMFFVDRGQQIVALVNAIIDNFGAILDGDLTGAATKVEDVMAKGLSLAISFLASLLGLGGITEKIKEIITAIRAPINKAVDWLLRSVVKPAAKLGMKTAGWVKGKVQQGAGWVKEKGEQGAGWIRSKLSREGQVRRTPELRKMALEAAMGEAQAVLQAPQISLAEVKRALPKIRRGYDVRELAVVVDKEDEDRETVHVEGANSPRVVGPPVIKPLVLVAQGATGAQSGPPPIKSATPSVSIGDRDKVVAEVRRELQEMADQCRDAFIGDPKWIDRATSAREQAAERANPWLYRANLGKSIERQVATWIMLKPRLRGLLEHTGPEGLADFTGRAGTAIAGYRFEVTTANPGTAENHMARLDDSGLPAFEWMIVYMPARRPMR